MAASSEKTEDSSAAGPHTLNTADFDLDRAFEGAPSWARLVELMNKNENLLRDVLALLTRESPKLGREFRQAVKKDSMKDARRAIHTLKGNVRHVGLTRIGAFAEQVEYLARDEKRTQIKQTVQLVAAVSNAVADWAEEMLNQNS
jgi:HPt (histidine-containing phosphotransfer) domain-containing protein